MSIIPRAARRRAGQRADAGFTLVELLVIVVVIGILAAIAIPTYTGVVRSSHKTTTKNWVTNATQLVYTYWLDNGAMPTTLDAAGVPAAPSDTQVQYFTGSAQFCLSAYWTGAPWTGGWGPTDDTYKEVYIPDAGRTSLTPSSPDSFCVNNGG